MNNSKDNIVVFKGGSYIISKHPFFLKSVIITPKSTGRAYIYIRQGTSVTSPKLFELACAQNTSLKIDFREGIYFFNGGYCNVNDQVASTTFIYSLDI